MTASASHWGQRSSLDRNRDALSDQIDTDRGDSFTAHCPCHDDSTASLSVTWRAGDAARGGLVLMNCHGCGATAMEIAEAVDLSATDLFDDPPPKRQSQDASERVGRSAQARRAGQRRSKQGRLPALLFPKPKAPSEGWITVCHYDYVDDEGRSVQEVIRKEVVDENGKRHKKFTQRFKDSGGVWDTQKPGGFTPVLYRQPQVRRAVAEGVTVWVMEGEKDVETAEAAGLVATTNAQGAGTFPSELAKIFTGADVRVVLDRDQGGAARGVELSALLTDAGAERVQLLLPATTVAKSDFTDHVDAGLLDTSSDTLGLIPISAQLAETDELRYKAMAAAEAVMAACREAEGRHERITANTVAVEQPKVRRWATEAEIRFEKARDLADELRKRVVADGGEEAHARLEEVEDIVGMAMRSAAEAHELAGMAIPPVLQPREEVVAPSRRPRPAPAPEPEVDDAAGSVAALATGGANAAEVAQFEGAHVQRPTYLIHEGRLVEVIYREDKPPTIKEVLSIDARLVSIEIEEPLDDAVDTALLDLLDDVTRETQRQLSPTPLPQVLSYTVGYTDPASGEFLEIPITARDYWDCRWLESLPGPPTFDSRPAGRAKVIDALKAAGQAAAGGVPQIVRHRATGWRKDEDGSWYYVHAAGGIDANGYRPAPVSFTGSLRNYALPRPSTDVVAIRAAFRDWCAGLLDVLPDRVAVPMLGQAFRAAMGPTPTVVTTAGLPGSYKTSIASLVMHHWGLGWDRARTGASMSGNGDTSNALRLKLNATKDCLLWADDVAPGKNNDWSAAQERLQEFARMVYNGEARSRATRDGQALLDGTPPRSSAIVTSEVTPQAGSSGGERMLIVPLFRDEVSLDDLIRMDDAQGHRARAMLMASFLQWAAGRLPQLRALCKEQSGSYAEQLRAEGVANRPAEALSNVWSGWFLWCEWLREVGALSDDEADQVLSRIMIALTEAWDASRDPDQPTSLGAQTRDLLTYALSSGLAYVEDVRKGGAPDWPLAARLGWTKTEIPSSMGDATVRIDRGRNRLGYVLSDPGLHDGEAQLMLDPAAFEAVLKAAASSMTSGLNVDRPSALKALCEEGTLIPEL
ncbi:MAG: telomere-binding protein, partial [Dietzia sp.]|nr:telomere-binding protein [Dietzia sp.]